MQRRNVLAATSLIALAALGLTACNSGEPGEAPRGDEITQVRVAALPIANLAPLYIAIEKGYFLEEGIEVVTEGTQGGAAAIPAMVAGDIDITYTDNVPIITAVSKGLPLVEIGQLTQIREDDQAVGVFVRGDSPIQTMADLAGGTLAVNSLGNITHLRVLVDLTAEGLSVDDVQFVEMPLTEIASGLTTGRVDAGFIVEPFTTMVKAQGARQISDAANATTAGIPADGLAATRKYVEENPETIAGFVRALKRGMSDAAADPENARAVLSNYTSLTPEQIASVGLPNYMDPSKTSSEEIRERLQVLAGLMVEFGLIDTEFDIAGIFE